MRAFTDEEKAAIKARLVKAAEKLFTEQGFSKTSVQELARAAGIGKGTFYMFYDSKEALLWDLHDKLHAEWEPRFVNIMMRLASEPEAALQELLRAAVGIFSSPLIVKLKQTGDFDKVYRTLSHTQQDPYAEMAQNPMVPLVKAAQEAGAIIPGDPVVITGTIWAICLIALHQDELGEELYEQVMDMLTSLVAKGLSRGRGPADD